MTPAGGRALGAYAAGHAFFGNQYSADVQAGASPQDLQLLAAAMNKVSGLPSAGKGGKSGGGKGGKGGAGSKAAKHAAAVQKAAARKQASAQHSLARKVAAGKKAAALAQSRAAHYRQVASQATTAHAKAAAQAKAQAYEQAAVALENAVAKLLGHRSDQPGEGVRHAGPGHDPVPTGHVKDNPARHRLAHKKRFVAASSGIEDELHKAMLKVFSKQERSVRTGLRRSAGMSRSDYRKARSGQRADTPPSQPPEPPQEPPQGTPGPDAAAIFDTAFWAAETAKVVQPILEDAAGTATGQAAGMLGLPTPDRSSLGPVFQMIAGRANQLAGQVTQTTYSQIQQAIADGVAAGDSITGIADRIRHVFQVARSRAELIARTETVGAMNGAAFSYASQLPAGAVGRKEWLAVHDARTRMTHRVADGQSVPLNMPFVVGSSLLMHPGDPTAPPDEVCNCRCTLLYHPGAARLAATPHPIGEAA